MSSSLEVGTATQPAQLTPVSEPVTGRGARAVIVRLVLGSSAMLFIELALIRWLGSNVLHLSYFTNFVLLGSFLGIGMGFLISRKSWSILPLSSVLLMLLAIAVHLFPVRLLNRGGNAIIYFTSVKPSGLPAWIALPAIFVIVAVLLAGPGEVVGRCFGQLDPLRSYRWDLIGSLLGIGTFTLISFLRAPSVVWGAIAAVLLVLLNRRGFKLVTALSGAGLILVLLAESTTAGISWSPYYKVQTWEHTSWTGATKVMISVNGIPHQLMAPADWLLTQSEPAYQQYSAPYERTNTLSLDNVLIVGAGSGSDVGIALSKGAKHVDAVDIDPRLVQIGAEKNPDHAYSDPRVTVYINDGRAFLQSTDTKYDLILFALPDSLALVNGASQIRLESFLFTDRALRTAHHHLKPGGVFAMYNAYRQGWLIDRLAETTAAAFGHQPCVDQTASHRAVITVAVDPANQKCATRYSPPNNVVAPSTDDRPFLYYKGGGIPALYLWTLAGIMLFTLLAVRVLAGPFRSMRSYFDLFFMGAAFLLLETSNIATFALLFGTTWLVNALVFGGVLVIVLAAVETTRKFRTPPLPVVWGAIVTSLAIAYVIDPAWLLGLPFWPRLILACVIGFLPVYLANIAFAKRFAATDHAQSAFAINLLGSILGGCLEYGALLTGYRNLLIVVGVLYLFAFLLTPKHDGALVSA
ncbi:Spermidine synthase [Mycobacterium basiliense]|uniref:Spermidine synthase n=1 Tax=Mycobacterium basiliense TaxID=2094119 RepID=A0A3S4DSB5_9MYCO|nr:methyltransferase domain-containing protein [Mycobacterium basiliense]VDM88028.1 Spermidine synthase [Mycobacterium basiliense]